MGNFNAVEGMVNGSFENLMGNFSIDPKSVKKSDQGNESSTNNIDAKVGKSYDKDIETSLLIKADPRWNSVNGTEGTHLFPEPSMDTVLRMAASISQYGLLHRITVWERPGDRYMILGGHTRFEAFQWLSDNTHDPAYDTIPARVYRADQLTEDDAHRIFIVSNTDQRTLSASAVANAYMALFQLETQNAFYGSGIYSRAAAAKQADVSLSTFNLYLSFGQLIPELRQALDNSDIALWPAYYLTRIGRNLQQHIFCKHNALCHGKSMSKDLGKALSSCGSIEAIDETVNAWMHKPKVYTYRIPTHIKMKKDETALPLLVPKKMRQSVKKLIIEHVDLLGLEPEAKERLISALASQV